MRSNARGHAGLGAELGQFLFLSLFKIKKKRCRQSFYDMAGAKFFESLITDLARQLTQKKHFNPLDTLVLIFNFFLRLWLNLNPCL